MPISRKKFRKNWLESINELTNFQLQQISWLNPINTNPHWSFTEFVCAYFDDLLIDFDYNHYIKIGWVSTKEFAIIKEWHDLLELYRPPNENSFDLIGILNDPEWRKILEIGNNSKIELSKILSLKEQAFLNEDIKIV